MNLASRVGAWAGGGSPVPPPVVIPDGITIDVKNIGVMNFRTTNPPAGQTFDIDWGDGVIETKGSSSSLTHTYGETGDYRINLRGVSVISGRIASGRVYSWLGNSAVGFNNLCDLYFKGIDSIQIGTGSYISSMSFNLCAGIQNVYSFLEYPSSFVNIGGDVVFIEPLKSFHVPVGSKNEYATSSQFSNIADVIIDDLIV